MDRLRDYLDHIREAAEQACAYVEGLDEADFLGDKRTQQAVILNLLILGEAAAKLRAEHPGFASRHPDLPWNAMKGMRNRIAHGYFDIDLGIVWATVQTALPQLLRQLLSLDVPGPPMGDESGSR